MNINDFALMAPMKYYDNATPATLSAQQKRQDIINNKDNKYIATVKHDGDWGMFIHYSQGHNLIRSRSLSKITGVYGDYTGKLPSLVTEMDTWPDNTVVLGELCMRDGTQTANTIGTILRCKPDKAIERQKTTPIIVYVFDMLMWNGIDMSSTAYADRAIKFSQGFNHKDSQFIATHIFNDSFQEHADEIIDNGGEGLVIQLKTNPYMPGTRTAWKTLKLKQHTPEMELQVLSTLDPTKEYAGQDAATWPYEKDGIKVTKSYFYGWKNGIRVAYNDTFTDVASGLTDDDKAWLATNEAQQMIKNGALIAVIRAMSENSRGALRHPVFVRFRYPEEY